MPYMDALSLRIKKLWPMLKFFKSRSKVMVKVTHSKFMVPSERPFHNENTCSDAENSMSACFDWHKFIRTGIK